MKIGDRVKTTKMANDSFYKQVEGVVTGFKNGFVLIDATRVISKWSDEWIKHPSFCSTSTKIENAELLD